MKKLCEDTTWKDAHPAFTCDLWHSRCMKEYFTITAHWIEIGGSPLAPSWELRHRVLGSYAVQDSPIDHQGACTVCIRGGQTFPKSTEIRNSVAFRAVFSIFFRPNFSVVAESVSE